MLIYLCFYVQELYRLTGEVLGQGAYASVQTCVNIYTEAEYAVKIIDKKALKGKEDSLENEIRVLKR